MNNNNESQQNIVRKNVLEKIRTGDVHMKSGARFVVQVAVLIVVAGLVLITSSVLASYIFFSLRVSGHQFLLGFGFAGVVLFLALFPWILSLVDIVLLFLFDWLLKRFKFGYRTPIVFLLLLTAVATIIVGFVINLTPLHSSLLIRAEDGDLPIIGNFYENLRHPANDRGVFRGAIISINGNSFVIKHDDFDIDIDDGTRVVVAPDGFDVVSMLRVGDRVFVAGTFVNNELHAYGVRKITIEDAI